MFRSGPGRYRRRTALAVAPAATGPSGSGQIKPAGGAEAPGAAHGPAQFRDWNELCILDTLDDHLGNSIAAPQLDGLAHISVQEGDRNLAAVAGVDRSRGIDDGEAV